MQATPALVGNARDAAAVDRALTAFRQTQRQVEDLDTPKAFRPTRTLYRAAVALYIEAARVYQAALSRTETVQLDLLARRLRQLGDRVFDRGRAALGIDVQGDTPEVDVNLPEDVPNWAAEGLAAGPPLDDTPPPAATSPPLREESRPEQPRAAWERDVRRAGAPTAAELRRAIAGGRPDAQRAIARRYVAAAEALRARPDPRDGREESARLRLAWLVGADAARAAQCVAAFGAVDLSDVARQLERAAGAISGVELG